MVDSSQQSLFLFVASLLNDNKPNALKKILFNTSLVSLADQQQENIELIADISSDASSSLKLL